MLTKELIKCHLLNEDVVVRQAIYRYLNNYNTCDDEVIDIIIQSQSKYQDHGFIYLLEPVYKNQKLIEYLLQLKKDTQDIQLFEHIDRVIVHAPSVLLNKLPDTSVKDYKFDENFSIKHNLKFRKKKHFSKKSIDELWDRYWILVSQISDCDAQSEEYKRLNIFTEVIKELLCEDRNLFDLEELIDKKLSNINDLSDDLDDEVDYLTRLILTSNIKKYSKKIFSVFSGETLSMLNTSCYKYFANTLDSDMLEEIKFEIETNNDETERMRYYDMLIYLPNDQTAKMLLEYLITDKDITNKTSLATNLCEMFYKESIPYIEKLIEHGYDEFHACIEENFYPLYKVFNIKTEKYDNIKEKAHASYLKMIKTREESLKGIESQSLSDISQNLMNTFANEKKMLKKLNKFYNKYKFEDVVINNK